jgi:hypothetical protein
MPSCNTPDEAKFVGLAAGEIVGGTNTRFSLGSGPLAGVIRSSGRECTTDDALVTPGVVVMVGHEGDDDAGKTTHR